MPLLSRKSFLFKSWGNGNEVMEKCSKQSLKKQHHSCTDLRSLGISKKANQELCLKKTASQTTTSTSSTSIGKYVPPQVVHDILINNQKPLLEELKCYRALSLTDDQIKFLEDMKAGHAPKNTIPKSDGINRVDDKCPKSQNGSAEMLHYKSGSYSSLDQEKSILSDEGEIGEDKVEELTLEKEKDVTEKDMQVREYVDQVVAYNQKVNNEDDDDEDVMITAASSVALLQSEDERDNRDEIMDLLIQKEAELVSQHLKTDNEMNYDDSKHLPELGEKCKEELVTVKLSQEDLRKYEHLSIELEWSKEERSKLTQILNKVEVERNTLAINLRESKIECNLLAQNLKESEREQHSLAQKLKQSERERNLLAHNLNEIEREKNFLVQDLQKMESELNEACKKNEELKEKADKLSNVASSYKDLQIKLEIIKDERNLLRMKLRDYREQDAEIDTINYLTREAEVLRMDRDNLKIQLAKLSDVEIELHRMQEKNDELEKAAAVETEKYIKMTEDIPKLKSTISTLKEQLTKIMEEKNQLLGERERLNNETDKLFKQTKQFSKDNEKLQCLYDQSNTVIADLRLELESTKKQNQEVGSLLRFKEQEISNLQKRLAQISEQLVTHENLKKQHDLNLKKLECFENENRSLSAELNARPDRDEFMRLKDENEKLCDQLSKYHKEYNSSELKALQELCTSLEQEKEKINKERLKLLVQVENLPSDEYIDSLQRENKELQNKLQTVSDSHEQLTNEVLSRPTPNKVAILENDLIKLRHENYELQNILVKYKESESNSQSDFQKMFLDMKMQYDEARTQIDEAIRQRDDFMRQAEESNRQRNRATENWKQCKKDLFDLQEEVKELKEINSRYQDNASEKIPASPLIQDCLNKLKGLKQSSVCDESHDDVIDCLTRNLNNIYYGLLVQEEKYKKLEENETKLHAVLASLKYQNDEIMCKYEKYKTYEEEIKIYQEELGNQIDEMEQELLEERTKLHIEREHVKELEMKSLEQQNLRETAETSLKLIQTKLEQVESALKKSEEDKESYSAEIEDLRLQLQLGKQRALRLYCIMEQLPTLKCCSLKEDLSSLKNISNSLSLDGILQSINVRCNQLMEDETLKFENYCTSLHNILDGHEDKLEVCRSLAHTLNNEKAELNDELKSIKRDFQKIKDVYENCCKKYRDLDHENKNLKHLAADMQNDLRNRNNIIQQLQNELQNIATQKILKENTSNELKEYKESNRQLSEKVGSLEKQLEIKIIENKQLFTKLIELETINTVVESLSEDLREHEVHKEETLIQKLESLEKGNLELGELLSTKQSEINSFKEENENLKKTIGDMKKTIEEFESGLRKGKTVEQSESLMEIMESNNIYNTVQRLEKELSSIHFHLNEQIKETKYQGIENLIKNKEREYGNEKTEYFKKVVDSKTTGEMQPLKDMLDNDGTLLLFNKKIQELERENSEILNKLEEAIKEKDESIDKVEVLQRKLQKEVEINLKNIRNISAEINCRCRSEQEQMKLHYKKEIQDMQELHKIEIEKVNQSYQDALAKTKYVFEREKLIQSEGHKKNIEQLQKLHDEEMNELRKEYEIHSKEFGTSYLENKEHVINRLINDAEETKRKHFQEYEEKNMTLKHNTKVFVKKLKEDPENKETVLRDKPNKLLNENEKKRFKQEIQKKFRKCTLELSETEVYNMLPEKTGGSLEELVACIELNADSSDSKEEILEGTTDCIAKKMPRRNHKVCSKT